MTNIAGEEMGRRLLPFDWYIYILSWPILNVKVKQNSIVNISQKVTGGGDTSKCQFHSFTVKIARFDLISSAYDIWQIRLCTVFTKIQYSGRPPFYMLYSSNLNFDTHEKFVLYQYCQCVYIIKLLNCTHLDTVLQTLYLSKPKPAYLGYS